MLRKTFVNHLLKAIDTHEKAFRYMYERGFYPAYDLVQLLHHDVRRAQKALAMRYDR
ncbi:spore coat protein [Caldibacillus thermoamylovorans]